MTTSHVPMSAPAVAALVSRLEREPVTLSQVRHLPIAPARDARGALQYGRDDLALVRLAVRLTRLYRRERWPLWKMRAALLYLSPLLRVRLTEADRYALVVNTRDATALVMSSVETAALPAGVVIPLATLISDDGRRRVGEGETSRPVSESVGV